jgi:hypothetical protein
MNEGNDGVANVDEPPPRISAANNYTNNRNDDGNSAYAVSPFAFTAADSSRYHSLNGLNLHRSIAAAPALPIIPGTGYDHSGSSAYANDVRKSSDIYGASPFAMNNSNAFYQAVPSSSMLPPMSSSRYASPSPNININTNNYQSPYHSPAPQAVAAPTAVLATPSYGM